MVKIYDEHNDPSLQTEYRFQNYQKNNLALPIHLGGHYDISNIDTGLFDYIKNKYNINSMLEIGCGLGKQVDYAVELGVDSVGVDGDYTVARSKNTFVICDLCQSTPNIGRKFDLVWSIEFVEHMHEKFIPNFMQLFQLGTYAIITHAFPGQKGHHHVNCQQSIYWIDVFDQYGFDYIPQESREMKLHSTMQYPWIQNSGLFFIKRTV